MEVHFRSDYGLTNTNFKKFTSKELAKMLDLAWSLNIKELDLAETYGDIIKKISDYHKISKNRFKITNKIYSYKTQRNNNFNHIFELLKRQKKSLDIDSFDLIMIHNPKAVPPELNNDSLES